MTKQERKKIWVSRIAEYRSSGQKVREWCKEHGVNPNQLWYWLRKENNHTSSEPKFSWLPVGLNGDDSQESLTVTVGQVLIDVKPGFDQKLLLDVVRTLTQL